MVVGLHRYILIAVDNPSRNAGKVVSLRSVCFSGSYAKSECSLQFSVCRATFLRELSTSCYKRGQCYALTRSIFVYFSFAQ